MKVELNREERSIKCTMTEIEWNRFLIDARKMGAEVLSAPLTDQEHTKVEEVATIPAEEKEEEKAAPEPVREPDMPTAPRPKKMVGSRVSHLFPGFNKKSNEDYENKAYRGFMHLKCERCGETKTYFSKTLTNVYNCRECNHDTYFSPDDIKRAFLTCKECGHELKYWTNEDADRIEIECHNCGTPNTLIKNLTGTAYKTER